MGSVSGVAQSRTRLKRLRNSKSEISEGEKRPIIGTQERKRAAKVTIVPGLAGQSVQLVDVYRKGVDAIISEGRIRQVQHCLIWNGFQGTLVTFFKIWKLIDVPEKYHFIF